VNKSVQVLPLETPRTRLKNHCHHAAEKLGTIPCGPPTEHRMKIARMRRKQEKVIAKRGKHKSYRDKRKINSKRYECTPIVKKRKIRPRSDGPITKTQQRGFISMRDKLCEQGIMSKDIRKDLKNEEVQQMMHMRRRRKK